MAQTLFITGANRGLGLEFVTQYAKEKFNIIATCRDPSSATELQNLQTQYHNIQIHQLDVTSDAELLDLKKKITQPIDILINNAGMLVHDPLFGNLSTELLCKTFLTNSVSPLKVTEAFADNLSNSHKKLVVSLSSSMGSISENIDGSFYSYCASKAALNMLMKCASIDLKSQGIKFLVLSPGWVKTRMGGVGATIEPQESIAGMRKVIENYNPEPGEVFFYNYDGMLMSW